MTDPYHDPDSRPISVAELLARSGSIGAPPPGGRRRRRRGNADAVTVAELTGEIPVVRTGDIPVVDEELEDERVEHRDARRLSPMNGTADRVAEPTTAPKPALYREAEEAHDYEPDIDDFMDTIRGPVSAGRVRAEQMAPDTVDEVEERPMAPSRDPDDLPSYLRGEREHLFGGLDADLMTEAPTGEDDEVAAAEPLAGISTMLRGGWIVLQSIIAVAFGAGLFMGFDQLWKWNNIVALVLSVLVILGLVVAVRIVRKTEDIASTLIAVAVGALVTLGPLALLQSN
jgi:hypothetical protein